MEERARRGGRDFESEKVRVRGGNERKGGEGSERMKGLYIYPASYLRPINHHWLPACIITWRRERT